MDDQFLPGARYLVCDHVVRPGWDGPSLIRKDCWDGKEEALRIAGELEPRSPDAVAVRAYDSGTQTWADDGTPAFKHSAWRTL